MSNTPTIKLSSLRIGQHVSGTADSFNGHIDEFRISQIQRTDG
jgi:hypothetical protein